LTYISSFDYFPHHLTSAFAVAGKKQKLHLFTLVLYYCRAKLQPVAVQ